MDRESAKILIRNNRPAILQKVREKVSQRHIHGEYREILLNGKTHKMLCYPSEKRNAPVYFDIHGGGFAWGMMEEGDLLCHHINEQLGFTCYSLDYPLCPDAEYPEALYLLYDIISYLRSDENPQRNFDPQRMVIGGRSAGGNLAAALCILASQRNEFRFICQLLDHPALDGCGIIPDSHPMRYKGEGSALNAMIMDGIFSAYADEDDRKEPLVSPLAASEEILAKLPPAVIQTCELDYLRPEGDLYAEKLKNAGVPVISHCYPNVTHGFTEVEGPDEIPGQQYLIVNMNELLSNLI